MADPVRVLVVDDDPLIRQLISMNLTLEIATSRWVTWFNTSMLHSELDDQTPTPAEVEQGHYRDLGGATAA